MAKKKKLLPLRLLLRLPLLLPLRLLLPLLRLLLPPPLLRLLLRLLPLLNPRRSNSSAQAKKATREGGFFMSAATVIGSRSRFQAELI